MKTWGPFLLLVCGLLEGCRTPPQQPAIQTTQVSRVQRLIQVEAKIWLLTKHPSQPLLAIQAGRLDEASAGDTILVVDLNTKQELFREYGFHPTWSPQGEALYFSYPKRRVVDIGRYDLASHRFVQAFHRSNRRLYLLPTEQCWLDRSRLILISPVPLGGREPLVCMFDLEQDRLTPLFTGFSPALHPPKQLIAYLDKSPLGCIRIRPLSSKGQKEWCSQQKTWGEIGWNRASGSLVSYTMAPEVHLTVWSGKHPKWRTTQTKVLPKGSRVFLVDAGARMMVVVVTAIGSGEKKQNEVSVLDGETLQDVMKFTTRFRIGGICYDKGTNRLILSLIEGERSTIWAIVM